MKISTLINKKHPLGTWLLAIALSLLLTCVLAPIAIWINIEHGEILYQSRLVQGNLTRSNELRAKLEVEHSRLISPYALEEKAKDLSMSMASSGQVRRLIPALEIEEARQEKEKRARELEELALIEKEKAQIALIEKEKAEQERRKLEEEEEENNFILQETNENRLMALIMPTISREMLIEYAVNIGNIDIFEFTMPKTEENKVDNE